LTASDVIQVVLVGVVIWYTVETRKYRKASERQLALLREQDRLHRQPALIVGVKRWAEEAVASFLKNQMHMSEEEVRQRVDRARVREPILVCRVLNVLESPPLDVKAILFDAVRQTFILSDQGSDMLPQGQGADYTFTGEGQTRDDLLQRLQDETGGYAFLAGRLSAGEESFVAVIFKDMAGQEYLYQRPFVIQEGGRVAHKPGRLIPLPALADEG